jgi:hypothetical protein
MSMADALSHLDRLLRPFDQAFLVLDGIDEIPTQRLRSTFFKHLRSLECFEKLSIMLISRPDIEIKRLLAPLHHVCDVCNQEREPKLYHCDDHEDGGYDICVSCYGAGSARCPEASHAEPTLLHSSITKPFAPQVEDMELYVRHRLQQHDLWHRIQTRKDDLQHELIEMIVGSAGSR